ncbi:WapI family immunity protein [Cellulophaga lytica]|uniref:Uncharacterized protein n=1 Tax=Cellulophaga lytica (strain ATCC 23178 / DSM 7489 / JCM 8516 / NBRC 14961 / NCIMB 1423 / VKM B-1433 / Cy l20) TaxID=867900 RepID=F0RIG1_CELLC|nr:hypothetical protein [Cellulophaga lytica]ADY29290.1 hypothetical protein Celly_1465 [Cellulophaga lytica DSM 7489]WQG76535.1 hypothetical protein SR888_12660 [Cellulophaga lytica]SNQ44537.1 conserved hypothetical protein [Cellulophaga lytica]
MIFHGINNQIVELKITNYQFPKITDCEYDSNWLLIYLNVKSDCGNWQTVDPSLLVGDVIEIIEWFEKISQNKTPKYECLDFIEPNLAFELIKAGMDFKTVRIKFDLESRPKSADDKKDYFVDCKMDNSQLQKVIEGLKKELKPYPIRAVR